MKEPSRSLWVALALLAAIPRLVEAWTEPAYLHPDAIHQALEPAFSLVHGYWRPTWEWREGARSWVWPGVLALPFWGADALGLSGPGRGMAVAIGAARSLVALLDAAGALLGAALARRLAGWGGATAVALVSALSPALVTMGAQPLVDVPAAVALMWASERAHAPATGRAHAWGLGAALGVAFVLRVQLAPAVLVLATARWFGPRRLEGPARPAFATALLAPILLAGALDWATWGAPFHSLGTYLAFNLGEGRTAFGVMPADRYAHHFLLAFDVLAPALLVLAAIGAVRAPLLGLVVLAVLVPHQLVPYKVWRFLHPAMPAMVVLAAVGSVRVVERVARGRRAPTLALAAAGLALVLAASLRAGAREGVWRTTWLYNEGGSAAVDAARGLSRAYLELGRRERLDAVVQAVLPGAAAPGVSSLGHDVPVVHVLDGDRLAPGAGPEVWWIVRDPDGGVAIRADQKPNR